MKKETAVIVIPIYKIDLTPEEQMSLDRCFSILNNYPIAFIKPESLNIERLLSKYPAAQVVGFEDKWFKSVYTYNELVLQSFFYQAFVSYDYMLIYQLDAYVFQDNLSFWVSQGYDYIGAPWLPESNKYEGKIGNLHLKLKKKLFKFLRIKMSSVYYHYQVGNGGLSLRKLSKMIEITTELKKEIDDFLNNKQRFFQEDVFLCIQTKQKTKLNVPDYLEALAFAFELNPQLAYKKNNNRLPFGCHDWYRKKRWDSFWSNYINIPKP